MREQLDSSMLDGDNAIYLEEMLEQYLIDANLVPDSWRNFFAGLNVSASDLQHKDVVEYITQAINNPVVAVSGSGNLDSNFLKKQVAVLELINAYRSYGHVKADIDPLGLYEAPISYNALELDYYGLTKSDLDIEFEVRSFTSAKTLKLGKLLEGLNKAYCNTVGVEYMHIPCEQEREWLQGKIESNYYSSSNVCEDEKITILDRLTAAEGLEKFLGAKYPGAKRFSAEGAESMIVMLDTLIEQSGIAGAKEVVIGMPHRGRLNVLVNNLGKDPGELFSEFEGKHNQELSAGDVKYHQGFSADVATKGGNVHLSLAFNPSHLEIVTPVVTGSVRARQLKHQEKECGDLIIPVAFHGDSAIAGQGVVMETLNLSQTRGYGVGGTVHIVVNNQVGFTTNKACDVRSTLYCSDVAKTIMVPIFHVNGDDPEAVYLVTKLALDYRMKFKKDVVIDLVCYRRHGHNEADEPQATQPIMYKVIKKLATTRKKYADKLTSEGVIDESKAKSMAADNRKQLEEHKCVARNIIDAQKTMFDWQPYLGKDSFTKVEFEGGKEKLISLHDKLSVVANSAKAHSRVEKAYAARELMAKGEASFDWGAAETLAYATLLDENYSIRISGQDSGRGTFFHRHAVIHDQETGEEIIPLNNINSKVKFEVIDSVLSEEAVLAFEYGYSCTDPESLVIWEAQFGDFANGAQVVIDQFISSGEHKWGRYCSLAMLLPHGYEGMGPEHSSARLERFLQLCAEKNMQVCVPSTPAQNYHLLRRQLLGGIRKPLIVMSPKSLLRHKEAVSSLEELVDGKFLEVIPELREHVDAKITRVVMCSGKVYYDLLDYKLNNKLEHVVLIRVEQLYPFPVDSLSEQLKRYTKAKDVVWCQEEPRNQGAWYSCKHRFEESLQDKQVLRYVGRKPSSSPAVGYAKLHNAEQEQLIKEALD